MPALAAIVDLDDLLKVVLISLAAGMGIAFVYSFVLLGGIRSAEARRAGHGAAATAYALLFALTSVIFLGGIVLAVRILVVR